MTHSKGLRSVVALCSLCFLLFNSVQAAQPESPIWLDRGFHHLRSGQQPEWESFAASLPKGSNLVVEFLLEKTPPTASIFWSQEDVKLTWNLELNGKRIASLPLYEFPTSDGVDLPAGLLRAGTNRLLMLSAPANDDVRIGKFRLHPQSKAEVLSTAILEVEVRDRQSGTLLPSRLTLMDPEGAWVPVNGFGASNLAVRPGVVYSSSGQARIGLMAGKIQITAGRGPDYSHAQRNLQLKSGDRKKVRLEISREVKRDGWVSSDPHIHTLTYSGHGDSTLAERLITLAGEDVDFPISTEHNRHDDYTPASRAAGLEKYFHPITGNEVTTRLGHFNIFPVSPAAAAPKVDNLENLSQQVGQLSGVQVIILNHPRDTHAGFSPFNGPHYNPVTGELNSNLPLAFNAVEVLNSGALRSAPTEAIHDWMLLLNRGHRLTAVAASDSHDVSRFIVGQGRTHLRVDRSLPPQDQARQVVESYASGKAVASLGLFPWLEVEGAGPGETLRPKGKTLRVRAGVSHASWIKAAELELFANGVRIRERVLKEQSPNKLEWVIPTPPHDVHLVLLASGPGVRGGHWAVAKPYQTSGTTRWTPKVLGVTNPVWVDADGDGKFTSPRGSAQQLISRAGGSSQKALEELTKMDFAIRVQSADLLWEENRELFERVKKEGNGEIRKAFDLVEESQRMGPMN